MIYQSDLVIEIPDLGCFGGI